MSLLDKKTTGDAVRLTGEPGRVVRASEASELLVWSFSG